MFFSENSLCISVLTASTVIPFISGFWIQKSNCNLNPLSPNSLRRTLGSGDFKTFLSFSATLISVLFASSKSESYEIERVTLTRSASPGPPLSFTIFEVAITEFWIEIYISSIVIKRVDLKPICVTKPLSPVSSKI